MKKAQKILIKRINDLCKERGITYYTLSYRSSVPLTTLTHILSGNTINPGIFTIAKICDGLDISLSEFFDEEEFGLMFQEDNE